MGVVVVIAAGLAVALAVPGPRRTRLSLPAEPSPSVEPVGNDPGPVRRWRPAWAVLACVGAAVFLGGTVGVAGGVLAGGVVWHLAGKVEPRDVRRRREAMRRDLPHVVALLGAALGAGADPAVAIWMVTRALPGPAADQLAGVAAQLEIGADPARVWGDVAEDPALGPLGSTLLRAQRSGASVVAATDRLAEDLAAAARAEVEDRARAVGVRAAVPLGVCLLPAFLLLGIVPLVAGLLGQVGVA